MTDITPLPISGEIKGALEFQREVNRILQGVKFDSVKPIAPYFLPDTELPIIIQNFWLRGGGMGDKICMMPALTWLAKNCPWIWGRIWMSEAMFEFTDNILKQAENPNWKVMPLEKYDELVEPDTRVRGRGFEHNGHQNSQYANGTGGHLVDLGFIDFTNTFPPPENSTWYPQINWEGRSDVLPTLYKKYVVLTTGAVSPARDVPGSYWNPIIENIKSRGLTPVFLGTSGIKDLNGILNVRYSDGCNYAEGIDLRDKTTVMEAAWIMKNAAAVIGLDNGLIQLASCTDADIICAYNIVEPRERRPRRRSGKWHEIYLSQAELACSGCQTHMKMIAPPHDFKRCLYGHLRCVDLIFANNGERFTKRLDQILT